MEFILGKENIIADWLSRTTTMTDHEEASLAEEYVINEVKSRLDGYPLEYNAEMKKLVEIVKWNDWDVEKQKRYSAFFNVRHDLTIRENMLFRLGTRFVPSPKIERRS